MVSYRNLALVTDQSSLPASALAVVASALQTQVVRDFAPRWRITAGITVFPSLDAIDQHPGADDIWPMIVMDDIPVNAAGVHLDRDGHPFALIDYDDTPAWTLTASHECLEMLGDPLGNRLRSAPSIKPGQGRVRYLVEVCDPSEADANAYEIDGVTVSDFYFPSYFRPTAGPGTRFSFTGAIHQPLQVLPGGYLSWLDPATGRWWQQTWFTGDSPVFRDLGPDTAGNPRRFTNVEAEIPPLVFQPSARARGELVAAVVASAPPPSTERPGGSRAAALRADIKSVIDEAGG
jgi:hypothetical protein